MTEDKSKKNTWLLTISALGVVYGDLGTSPLYALQQSLINLPINTLNILGVLSLVFWSLILVISTCYISVFLNADNEGEGGILALLSLLKRQGKNFPRFIFLMGLIGAGLLLGDGMITPAISVISAIEGLNVISPQFSHLIMPISFGILFLLFLCQRFGTGKIGLSFGPILFCWFIIISILGAIAIYHEPSVLYAVNPYYAVSFLYYGGWPAFILLSGVFLVITGAEAMYADLGHFGKTPIRIGWFVIVLPALLLNYFGQGANLLRSKEAIANSFYSLAPSWFSIPLLIIATLATIIASQAVISASFSLAKQAILLNVLPRLSIIHTSKEEKGQVYVPKINLILATGTLLLVLIFKSSGNLAAAFGMAVNLVMIIVAILVMCVARAIWNWSIAKIIRVFSVFMIIDLTFLVANLHKIYDGAWIPLIFAFVCYFVMITWQKGVQLIHSYYLSKATLPDILKQFDYAKLNYLEELTTIFITDPYDKSGSGFFNYLKLNRITPKQALIVNVEVENYPYISEKNRFELSELNKEVYQLTLHYGFMQTIHIPKTLALGDKMKIFPFPLDINKVTYLVEILNIGMTKKRYPRLLPWQKNLFSFLLRNSALDVEFYQLPYNRTIAIGTYIEL